MGGYCLICRYCLAVSHAFWNALPGRQTAAFFCAAKCKLSMKFCKVTSNSGFVGHRCNEPYQESASNCSCMRLLHLAQTRCFHTLFSKHRGHWALQAQVRLSAGCDAAHHANSEFPTYWSDQGPAESADAGNVQLVKLPIPGQEGVPDLPSSLNPEIVFQLMEQVGQIQLEICCVPSKARSDTLRLTNSLHDSLDDLMLTCQAEQCRIRLLIRMNASCTWRQALVSGCLHSIAFVQVARFH